MLLLGANRDSIGKNTMWHRSAARMSEMMVGPYGDRETTDQASLLLAVLTSCDARPMTNILEMSHCGEKYGPSQPKGKL